MFLALPAPPMPSPPPLATPQALRQHPAPQRLRVDGQPILAGQMLRRQRWPKALVHGPAILLPYQLQYLPPEFPLMGAIRQPSRTAVLQPGSTFLAIALPQPLHLPITHAHQPASIHQQQLPTAHPRQHSHTLQLLLGHPCPPQSDLLPEVLLRGHFYRGQKGTLSSRYNRRDWGAVRVELDWPAGGTIMTRLYRWTKVAVCMFALSMAANAQEKKEPMVAELSKNE